MKTGLILEGGGMRGLFTAGILDVMMERDIRVDLACQQGRVSDATMYLTSRGA